MENVKKGAVIDMIKINWLLIGYLSLIAITAICGHTIGYYQGADAVLPVLNDCMNTLTRCVDLL